MFATLLFWCFLIVPLLCHHGDNYSISAADRVEVIKSLKHHFRSGCVFMVESSLRLSRDSLQKIKLVQKQKQLSAQIATTTLSTNSFPADVQCRRNRPLLVVNGNERDGIFHGLSNWIRMSDYLWLLFVKVDINLAGLLDGINIPFDCQLLVAHPQDHVVVLTEVYRVHPTFPLKMRRFGIWSARDGLTPPKEGFYARRNNLEGLTLKTAFKFENLTPNTISASGVSSPYHLYMRVWYLLEKEINFTTRYHFPRDKSYGVKKKDGKWTGVIGMLHRREVDIANSDLTVTSPRTHFVDYTVPVFSTKYYLTIRESDTFQLKWTAFVKPFSSRLWLSIGAVVAMSLICLIVAQQLRVCCGVAEVEDTNFITAVFLSVCVICAQGHSFSFRSSAVRLVMLTLYLTAEVLSASYSAGFLSYVALRNPTLPFTDFSGFLKDGSYQLGMQHSSATEDLVKNTTVPLLREIYKKCVQPYESLSSSDGASETLQMVCNRKKLAYITSSYNFRLVGSKLNCTLIQVPQAFLPSIIAFGLTKNNPYSGLFNHRLQNMRRQGLLRSEGALSSLELPDTALPTTLSIGLSDVAPMFFFVAVGMVISVVVLAVENILKIMLIN